MGRCFVLGADIPCEVKSTTATLNDKCGGALSTGFLVERSEWCPQIRRNRRRALIDIYKREDSGHLPGRFGVTGLSLPIVTMEKQQSETSTKCPKAGLRPEPKSMC